MLSCGRSGLLKHKVSKQPTMCTRNGNQPRRHCKRGLFVRRNWPQTRPARECNIATSENRQRSHVGSAGLQLLPWWASSQPNVGLSPPKVGNTARVRQTKEGTIKTQEVLPKPKTLPCCHTVPSAPLSDEKPLPTPAFLKFELECFSCLYFKLCLNSARAVQHNTTHRMLGSTMLQIYALVNTR